MRRSHIRWMTVGILTLALGIGTSWTQGETGKSKENEKDKAESPKVFTNEDLDRRFPNREGTPAQEVQAPRKKAPGKKVPGKKADALPETPEGVSPLAWLEQKKKQDAERRKNITEAESAVAQNQKAVTDLETRVLAIRNPLLARPSGPNTDEGSAAERLAAAQAELARARGDLQDSRRRLSELRAGR